MKYSPSCPITHSLLVQAQYTWSFNATITMHHIRYTVLVTNSTVPLYQPRSNTYCEHLSRKIICLFFHIFFPVLLCCCLGYSFGSLVKVLLGMSIICFSFTPGCSITTIENQASNLKIMITTPSMINYSRENTLHAGQN